MLYVYTISGTHTLVTTRLVLTEVGKFGLKHRWLSRGEIFLNQNKKPKEDTAPPLETRTGFSSAADLKLLWLESYPSSFLWITNNIPWL